MYENNPPLAHEREWSNVGGSELGLRVSTVLQGQVNKIFIYEYMMIMHGRVDDTQYYTTR
jgi:hypothetical protein